jgi:hypothetical protein
MPASARLNFHGDPSRFPAVRDLVLDRFGGKVRYIADVAGGQGMLARMLRKANYDVEVIDPRGWRLRGVPGFDSTLDPAKSDYYDLIVGLHPDEATQAIVMSSLVTKTVIVPCCNFWDRTQRLGAEKLIEAIEAFYRKYGVEYERVKLAINTPKNIALITTPPLMSIALDQIELPSLKRTNGQFADRNGWLAGKTSKGRSVKAHS